MSRPHSKPRILVTGATGKTGLAVTNELLAREFPVRALVHRDDARAADLRRRGAEVIAADLFDPEQLHRALQGVDRAYFVPVIHPHMIESGVAFRIAAAGSRLESVVHMGQWLSHPGHPAAMTRQTWLLDHLLADLPDTAHTLVNPGMFADNFLRTIDLAALLGLYPVLTGDGRAAVVATEDMARVVVAVLTSPDPQRHAGRSYRPTGPALLSGCEMAQVIARVVGHRVRAVNLPFSLFTKVARQQGIDPYQVGVFRHYVEEMRRGTFALDGGVTDVVERLTGRPAETFETTARRYAALPFAAQTAANRLRAAVDFALVPFYRGYDVDRDDRRRGLPAPSGPTLSIDDERWRTEHTRLMQHAAPATATPPATLNLGSSRPAGPALPRTPAAT